MNTLFVFERLIGIYCYCALINMLENIYVTKARSVIHDDVNVWTKKKQDLNFHATIYM